MADPKINLNLQAQGAQVYQSTLSTKQAGEKSPAKVSGYNSTPKVSFGSSNSGMQVYQPVVPTKQVEGQPAAAVAGQTFAGITSKSILFAGNTVGVNTNIGVGNTSFLAAQAGKAPGKGTTRYIV